MESRYPLQAESIPDADMTTRILASLFIRLWTAHRIDKLRQFAASPPSRVHVATQVHTPAGYTTAHLRQALSGSPRDFFPFQRNVSYFISAYYIFSQIGTKTKSSESKKIMEHIKQYNNLPFALRWLEDLMPRSFNANRSRCRSSFTSCLGTW